MQTVRDFMTEGLDTIDARISNKQKAAMLKQTYKALDALTDLQEMNLPSSIKFGVTDSIDTIKRHILKEIKLL
jgi:hypothetical protein